MRFLYDLNLRLYFLLLQIVAFWHPRAKLFVKSRRGAFGSIAKDFIGISDRILWIHVASLGEYEQAKPILKELKIKYPSHRNLITFYSPSGYQVARKTNSDDLIHYLPFDSKRNASRFLELVKPELAIFIKYELWYHYLIQLKNRNIPTLMISATFRPDQFYFEPYGHFFKKAFQAFDHFFVQNEQSEEILRTYGFDNISICGDTRFDRVKEVADGASDLSSTILKQITKPTLVLGSIWPSDLVFLSDLILKYLDKVRFIIAPHNIDEKSLSEFDHLEPVRYSKSTKEQISNTSVILLDTIGMLSAIYALADLAIVGGGSRGALHNILEPAAHGKPVLFHGHKNNSKFNEVKGLLKANGGFEYSSHQELESLVSRFLTDLSFRESIGNNSRKFVEENAGATQMIMSRIAETL